ncbi:MAG: response regulator transcription factor [Mycobacterium sp.]
MGWSQMGYAAVHPRLRSAETGQLREITDARGTFVNAARLRTVFVMDDELLRHGLIHVMSKAGGIQLVGDLNHGAGLIDRLRALRPELLVVGVDHGLPLAALLAELNPAPKVIAVMDGDDASTHALELIRAGADALVDRRSPAADLLGAVQRVIEGHTALDAHSANALIAQLRAPSIKSDPDYSRLLTRREREVLVLLTEGLDNRTIATKLFISEATVKFHLHNIMDKFGVHKRVALVSAALGGNRGATDGYQSAINNG